MTKTLLVTPDMAPPWNHGTKVYAKGLFDSLQKIDNDGFNVSITDTLEKIEGDYDYVHVVYTGSKTLREVLKKFRKSTVFKHIITPAVGFENAISTRAFYALIKPAAGKRLFQCFSSQFVAKSFFMQGRFIIPPSIDSAKFIESGDKTNGDRISTILEKSEKQIWLDNLKKVTKGLVLYSGPLTEDRFPFIPILDAIKRTGSNILIIGRRNADYSFEKDALEKIVSHSRKLDIDKKVSIALNTLTEEEKISLMNYSDLIVYPFSKKIKHIAVDPPIFLLECMSCQRPVITSEAYSLRYFIENGHNGFVVDIQDTDDFEYAITNSLNNKRTIGSNARDTILHHFSTDSSSKKLKEMYDETS